MPILSAGALVLMASSILGHATPAIQAPMFDAPPVAAPHTTFLGPVRGPEGVVADPAPDLPGGRLSPRGSALFAAVDSWSDELAPLSTPVPVAQARPSLRRRMAWGAVIGASAGLVSGLLVRSACDAYCDDTVAEGLTVHIGVGALIGGAGGALVHWLSPE